MFWSLRGRFTLLLFFASSLTASAGVGVWTTTGPAANVVGVAIDQQSPLTVIAAGKPLTGDPDAVFTRLDQGPWIERAEAPSGVTITSLRAAPSDPTTLYVSGLVVANGKNAGSVYVSHDSGTSWSFLHLFEDSPISNLLVDPNDSGIVFATGCRIDSLGCRNVLWKSSDGGLSWLSFPLLPGQIYSLAIDSESPSRLYVGTDAGLFTGVDSGSGWTLLFQVNRQETGGKISPVTGVAVNPSNPSTIYVSAEIPLFSIFSTTEVFVTRDGGRTWSKLRNSPITVTSFVFDVSHPGVIYAGGGGVLVSRDSGTTWSILGDVPSFGSAIVVDSSTETIFAAASDGVYEYQKPLRPPTLVPNRQTPREVQRGP